MSHTISVVIPVYNGEAFIARAINSVLSQTVKPFEVIVVNDGSKDATAEQLAHYGNEIKVISIPNGGVSNARNLGIKACTGDLIAFLDADDVWYADKLAQHLDVFERYPDVGFCCCNYLWFNKQLEAKVNHFSAFENDSDIIFDRPLETPPFEVLIKQNIVGTCSNVIIKREVLDEVGLFNVSYKQSEDYDLWIRCSLVTKFVLQSAALLEKKSHESNLTNNFLETLLFHEEVLINLKSNAQTRIHIHMVESKYVLALAKIRYEIGNLFYETNRRAKAFSYFFKGLVTTLTIENVKLFSHFFGRKLLRTLSFGLIKKRKN